MFGGGRATSTLDRTQNIVLKKSLHAVIFSKEKFLHEKW